MIDELDRLTRAFENREISRRQLVASLTAVLVGADAVAGLAEGGLRAEESGWSEGAAKSRQAAPAARAETLNHVSLAVSDVEASARFYQELLGLEVVSRPDNGGINLGLGPAFLGVYSIPDPGRVHHFCLGMEDFDADEVAASLEERGIEASIDRDPANRTTGGDQLYFTDPDGTIVQLCENGYQG